jgi:hypothetical protein
MVMRARSSFLLLALTMALVLGSAVVLGLEGAGDGRREEQARAFQGLVGGLGLGPGVDLSRCAFSFDPRLCDGCPEDTGPIPGGACFCPRHGCSILFYPPLDPQR